MPEGYTTACVMCGKQREKDSVDISLCPCGRANSKHSSYHLKNEGWVNEDCPHCFSVHFIPHVGWGGGFTDEPYYKCHVTLKNVREPPECQPVSKAGMKIADDSETLRKNAEKLNLKLW